MADWIPGINVGNIGRQAGDIIGLDGQMGSQTDYDIVDNYTISGRPNQNATQIGNWNPNVGGGNLTDQSTIKTDYTAPASIAQAPSKFIDGQGRSWDSQGAYNNHMANARNGINVQQNGYVGNERTTAGGNKLAYNNDSQDLVTNIRTGQNTINSGRIGNALNLRRSMAGIASGVRQGLRSGNVNLASMNAMDSSASDAMSRAFARQGNSQAASVNNEAQLKENELATTQENLNLQETQGVGRLQAWRGNKVAEISNRLWQNLSELENKAKAEGINGAVDMGARDRVVSEASQMLDEVDAITNAELAKINGLDYGQVQEQAAAMDRAGATASPFAYEGGTVQFGQPNGTGGAGAPVGTTPRYRDENGNPAVAPVAVRPVEDETVRV